jgi:hypothetical protein
MKTCQTTSISWLNASFNPIGGGLIGTLIDDVNSSSKMLHFLMPSF